MRSMKDIKTNFTSKEDKLEEPDMSQGSNIYKVINVYGVD